MQHRKGKRTLHRTVNLAGDELPEMMPLPAGEQSGMAAAGTGTGRSVCCILPRVGDTPPQPGARLCLASWASFRHSPTMPPALPPTCPALSGSSGVSAAGPDDSAEVEDEDWNEVGAKKLDRAANERSMWVPLRLSEKERAWLAVLKGALDVSE